MLRRLGASKNPVAVAVAIVEYTLSWYSQIGIQLQSIVKIEIYVLSAVCRSEYI